MMGSASPGTRDKMAAFEKLSMVELSGVSPDCFLQLLLNTPCRQTCRECHGCAAQWQNDKGRILHQCPTCTLGTLAAVSVITRCLISRLVIVLWVVGKVINLEETHGRRGEGKATLAYGPKGNMANVGARVLLKDTSNCVWFYSYLIILFVLCCAKPLAPHPLFL